MSATMPADTLGKIRRNAEIAWRRLSIQASWLLSLVTGTFLALNPAWVISVLTEHLGTAIAGTFAYGLIVHLCGLVPQNIQTPSDKEAAAEQARAETIKYFADLIAKAFPGQQVAMPVSVANTLGLAGPVVVTPPVVPVAVLAADPATAPAAMPEPAAAPAAPVDLVAIVRTAHPEWTDAQLTAGVQAAIDHLTQPAAPPKPSAIVMPPFPQPQPAPGMG